MLISPLFSNVRHRDRAVITPARPLITQVHSYSGVARIGTGGPRAPAEPSGGRHFVY